MVSLSIFPSWWCFMFLSSWKESFGRLHFERLNKTLIVRCQVVRDVHFSDTLVSSHSRLVVYSISSTVCYWWKPKLLEAGRLSPIVVLRPALPCHFRSSWFFIHLVYSLVLLQSSWEHPHLSGWCINNFDASFQVPVASVYWHVALSRRLLDVVPWVPFSWL